MIKELRTLEQRAKPLTELCLSYIYPLLSCTYLVGVELGEDQQEFAVFQMRLQKPSNHQWEEGKHFWIFDHRKKVVEAVKTHNERSWHLAIQQPGRVQFSESNNKVHLNIYDLQVLDETTEPKYSLVITKDSVRGSGLFSTVFRWYLQDNQSVQPNRGKKRQSYIYIELKKRSTEDDSVE